MFRTRHIATAVVVLICAAFAVSSQDAGGTALMTELRAEYYPMADAHVSSREPALNMPADHLLRVGKDIDGEEFLAYLYFDLSSIPPDCRLVDVDLATFLTEYEGAQGLIVCSRVADEWDEHEITYENRPRFSNRGQAQQFIEQPGWLNWDVEGIVAPWVGLTEPNYGFVLHQDEPVYQLLGIVSRDAPMPELWPRLSVTYRMPGQGPEHPVRNEEIDEYRDAFSKHYANEDGSITAVISMYPVHVRNAAGEWVEPETDEFSLQQFQHPSMDAYISSPEPNRNFGQDKLHRVGGELGGEEYEIYSYFDLRSLPSQRQLYVKDAMLTFFCSEFRGWPGTVNLSPVAGPWSEMELTYRNRPGRNLEGTAEVFVDGPGWYHVKPTQIVREWVSGDLANFGFCMYSNGMFEQILGIYSREHSEPGQCPVLTITYELDPRLPRQSGGSQGRATNPILIHNDPNPFAQSTTVRHSIGGRRPASVAVYSADGRLVRPLESGSHSATWDGRDAYGNEVSEGIYYCRVVVDGDIYEHKLVKAQ